MAAKVEKVGGVRDSLVEYVIAKIVQQKIKRYYNAKRSKGPDFKEGDKVYLFIKNFESKRLSKKLNYIKMGLFKIISKVTEVSYRLDLP